MDETQPSSLLFSFYESLPRQGRGDDAITREILQGLPGLPENPGIIDMGCGTGAQSLVLAERGFVTAVDFYQPFLDILMERAKSRGLEDRIIPLACSIDSLPPRTRMADLIWSEGAIYIIGFKNGLSLWWNLVKPGGFIVVSEATRLVDEPAPPAAAYWNSQYPGIKTIEENSRIITETGYSCMRTLKLPSSAWDRFYEPQTEKIRILRKETLNEKEKAILDEISEEIQIQQQYPEMYGYVFYVMQRPA